MSSFMGAKKWRREIFFIPFALLLSITLCAQGKAQEKDVAEAVRPFLRVKLQTLTPTACIGTPLKLKLEVTNIGREIARLNRAYFWNTYSVYSARPQDEDQEKEYFFTHVWPRSTGEDIIHLVPGKTYTSHTYWPLDDEVYSPGKYMLVIAAYGTRNQVEFEFKDCGRQGIKEHK